MNTFHTLLLSVLVPATFIACAAETDSGEASDDATARKPSLTTIVVASKDSPEAKAFLSTWMRRFGRLAASEDGKTTTEDDVSTYTIKRNDGTITCVEDLAWNRECTFKLNTLKVNKLPVSTGDRNFLSSTLMNAFEPSSGTPLGVGVTQEGDDALTIGTPGKRPSIECKRIEPVRGLETSECTFDLK